jgi:hypothetical protein
LEGMCWFMKKHIDIPDNIQKLYPHLAWFVLETTMSSVEVFPKDVSSCRK